MIYSGMTEEILDEAKKYLNSEQGEVDSEQNKQLRDLTKLCDYLLYNDSDLDVPNITAYTRRIDQLILEGSIKNFSTGRFNIKDVASLNSKYGFPMGSRIIKKYTENLKLNLGAEGQVYRIGGDNFIVLYKKENHEVVRRFLSYVEMETGFEEVPVIEMRSRTGYVLDLEKIKNREELLDDVNTAGQLAKTNNYSSFIIYDDKLRKTIEEAKCVMQLFPQALDREEFLVYYQPKINIKNNKLHGAEALCRWKHDGEMVYPGKFIPVLEQSYAICKLDFYMLEHVCKDIRSWLDNGLEVKPISINFSRLNLTEKNLAKHIISIIDKYDVPRSLVEIELTETTVEGDFVTIRQLVLELRSCGVGTSIDDFGVGYSSLNLLRDMPWKVLKLDKCFLPTREDGKAEQKTIVLRSMISMANDLGIECLSEGAEDIDQVKVVEKCGCDIIQGDYFYKPMNSMEYENLMEKK